MGLDNQQIFECYDEEASTRNIRILLGGELS